MGTGLLITFEGPDGAGKTSVLNTLFTDYTRRLGSKLVTTREPGGNKISEAIRSIIMDQANVEMDARTEALLFAAARRQHLMQTVRPALNDGKIVFSDRYVDSSIAYQGAGRNIGEQAVADMNQFATEGLTPDLTVYFDVPSEVGLARIHQYRSNEINRLDDEELSFHQRVRQAYLKLVAAHPERIVVVDATQSFDDVVHATNAVLVDRFPGLFN
ncbi:dTMP kinase [Furfurilactobacillus siliginis]|uniref:Thymidylate kinase n=1 Tax=Furfurilactobacillus siliginis TaxID=348151 RepID=A0A0R2LBY6_9LACO|nr:dTMP kinase [Furfurilactobacillus siliginis]KRN96570.1 thymidylate kinase [Furfurilactobacillus siliginis]GEK29022.1 thymidylate kinase [Furfurilactobacillus siliginis]